MRLTSLYFMDMYKVDVKVELPVEDDKHANVLQRCLLFFKVMYLLSLNFNPNTFTFMTSDSLRRNHYNICSICIKN